jgi:hypothetical protein
MIETDGVGVSIHLRRADQPSGGIFQRGRRQQEGENEQAAARYVDELTEEERAGLRQKKVVGIDPGKDDILHCTDGQVFYRYTANQRRIQTKKKKYAKIVHDARKFIELTYDNERKSVMQWEAELSETSKYACMYEEFEEHVEAKLRVSRIVKDFYALKQFRKMRWKTYINTQRSEAKMINLIKKRFGEPSNTVIAIGDFDPKGYHMPGKEPTKGKGMRTTLRRAGYDVYLVDEYKTSCTCHKCHARTKKFMRRASQRPKTLGRFTLVHGILRCTNQECRTTWNRDVNGCLNIRQLAVQAINGQSRPEAFKRRART